MKQFRLLFFCTCPSNHSSCLNDEVLKVTSTWQVKSTNKLGNTGRKIYIIRVLSGFQHQHQRPGIHHIHPHEMLPELSSHNTSHIHSRLNMPHCSENGSSLIYSNQTAVTQIVCSTLVWIHVIEVLTMT